jgi:hypothetical protein
MYQYKKNFGLTHLFLVWSDYLVIFALTSEASQLVFVG